MEQWSPAARHVESPPAHMIQGQIEIPLRNVWLQGELTLPAQAKGMVLFAHGSGSSRFSSRNQFVATELQAAGLGTCLFDLLSLEEEREDQISSQYRFDIPLLAHRLMAVTDWLMDHLAQADQPLALGYFGASTGAAAALIAASERPAWVKAVVSRGGRPDMAAHALGKVQAATLLLVGGLDDVVIELNRLAYSRLSKSIPKEMVVIEGAGHLFEESGKLAYVAQAASQWFERYLTG
jgi:putative phosphoribosyl transferase